MAYSHVQYEVIVAKAASLASIADIGNWSPGIVPHIIRAVAVVVTNSVDATGIVRFDLRPTAGSDTSRGSGDVATVNLTTAHVAGKAVYKDGLNVKVFPGQQVVATVSDVTAAGDLADIILYLEPSWEEPANNVRMVRTT